MNIIKEADAEKLASLDISFNDKRIAPLLFRYRARNFPSTLSESEQRRWASHCQDYFANHIEDYMLNLENLVHEYEDNESKLVILKSIYKYVEKLVS